MTSPARNDKGTLKLRGESKPLGESKPSLLYRFVSYINDIIITCEIIIICGIHWKLDGYSSLIFPPTSHPPYRDNRSKTHSNGNPSSDKNVITYADASLLCFPGCIYNKNTLLELVRVCLCV